MPTRYQKRLLTHLAHDTYEPSTLEQLADDLRIDPDEREDFKSAVQHLAEEGRLVLGDSGVVTLPPIGNEMVGSFKKHPKGFGFIIPRDPSAHGDLFVPAPMTNDAITGDIVRAEVVRSRQPRPGQSPFIGRIVEIIERKHSTFAGEVFKQGGQWLVQPDGKVLTAPIVLRDAESKHVKEGLKVAFEVMEWPEGDYLGEGVVTKILGEAGKPDVETMAVIESYQLPDPEFPEEVMNEARALNDRFREEMRLAIDEGKGFDPSERLDLRDTYITTIDPPDAKDYDDAISIERLDDVHGHGPGYRLGIHIADVAHFVTPGTALNEEAAARGNSCYLPRLVIPMLPEVLSNGICSLQEGVPRYAKSVFIDYDRGGNVRGTGFASTLIQSSKRMTYLEAQALIDGNEEEARKHAKTEPKYTPKLRETLNDMAKLSLAIRERRRKNGMIHLDLPDVELIFDEDGHVVDAEPEDDAYTHTLIEMFMVEANEAVARLFEDLNVPVLRRIHPEPVPGEFDQLQDFVKVAGFRIPKSPTREELQGLLDATSGTPAAPAIHLAVLRTLTKAEYSPALIGHFALASEAYSHFTSPIRRYPDLTTHWALAVYLKHTENGNRRPRSEKEKHQLGKIMREDPWCLDEAELIQIGNACNRTEQNAEGAERELRQFLVLQLLEKHIGENFPGIVTGVTANGVFVRLDKYLAEGMCKASDLPVPSREGWGGGDFHKRALWQIDKRSGALVEKNSGRSYNIGDRVSITIAGVDLTRRQMDVRITDGEARNVGKAKTLARGLKIGAVEEQRDRRTGADKRAARSKSRESRKKDFRDDRKNKGKRQ